MNTHTTHRNRNNILSRLASRMLNKAAVAACSITALISAPAQAATYDWNGSSDGDWSRYDNWSTTSGGATTPQFNNQTILREEGTKNLNQHIRVKTTIKKLVFLNSNDGNTAIGLRANNGSGRNLTFSADSGDAEIRINVGSSGVKSFGISLDGTETEGDIVLQSNLEIDNGGTSTCFFYCDITGDKDIIISNNSAKTTFLGANKFTLGSNGANNKVRGSGLVGFNGDFRFNLNNASTTLGDSWEIVAASLDASFDAGFKVSSLNGDFIEISNGVWAIAENGMGYQFSEATGQMTVEPVAQWMKGGLGVGFRFRPHDSAETQGWVLDDTVADIKSIPGVRWVIFNLTDAAGGSQFLDDHSVLSDLHPVFVPNSRNLFPETLARFKAEGYKVIVYYATQGPGLLKHGVEKAEDAVSDGNGGYTSESYDAWLNYVEGIYGDSSRETLLKAHPEIIFAEFAERYGDQVDGWWFDQPADADNQLHYEIAKQHNPNTVVGMSSNTNQYNDYTKGHVLGENAADLTNLKKYIGGAELSPEGYLYASNGQPNISQYFSPIGESYNGGSVVWTADQAADWLERMNNAGGAWTWNFDLIDSEFGSLRVDMLNLVIAAQAKVEENKSNTSFPTFSSNNYDGGRLGLGSEYLADMSSLATDADGDDLYYSLVSGPAWLTVNLDGTVSGTPDSVTDVGVETVAISVGDGRGHSDITELEIEVVYLPKLMNVALGKTATQSSTRQGRVASRAIDGNTDSQLSGNSVSETRKGVGSTWEVDLGDTFKIYEMDLYGRVNSAGEARLSNFEVTIRDTNRVVQFQRTFNDNSDPSFSIDVGGLDGVNGQFVEVKQLDHRILSLAEIEVYAAVTLDLENVALGKSASQSSTINNGVASRAVDGNRNGDFSGNSVTQTDLETNAKWEVDLDGTFRIHEIKIFNRIEADAKLELVNFDVTVTNRNGVVNFQNRYTDFPDPELNIPLGGINGDFVTVTLLGDGVRLSLAEVEVLAEKK